MYIDFEYDGIKLSDMGYILCQFDSGGLETVSNGAQITFNTVPIQNGALYVLGSTQYDTCLETTFQICKNTCLHRNDMELTVREVRELSSWLSRNKYLKFKLFDKDDEYMNLYFEASFNINLIKFGGNIIGLELHMVTNRPFALMNSRTIMLSVESNNEKKVFYDVSDKEGYIYPYMEITMDDKKNGEEPFTFTIINNAEKISANEEGRITQIHNCLPGEKIIFDYPTISSSERRHENILENGLPNDFNWVFFRIFNSFRNSKNEIVVSHPCKIKIVYSPIAMIGI